MNHVRALPRVAIEVDGVSLTEEALYALRALRVRQALSAPTQCEIVFGDLFGARADLLFAIGAALNLSVEGAEIPLFTGEVTAVEYVYEPARGQEVRVRGYDRLHRLRKHQSVHAHVEVTLPDLAREMTADLGLTVAGGESAPLWPRIIQHWQSDLQLLVDLAQRCGLYLCVRDDVLHLLTLEGTGERVPLDLGATLLEARIEVNGDPGCRTVSAAGWDATQAEVHTGRAASARTGRTAAAEAAPDAFEGDGLRHLLDEATPDDRHAEALAQAELDHRIAREVTFWGVAEGNPQLRPGTAIDVTGIADHLVGEYILTEVTHTIDDRLGFVSELSTVPPVPVERPAGAVTALGSVTRVDDPDKLGRVQVSLPAYEDVETGWLNVLCLGGGASKGIIALPNVGDRILLLLAHGDPAAAIVLGGLYGMDGIPDSGVEGNATRRFTFVTHGGQRVQLDDQHNTLRLENGAGSFVELAPGKVRLNAHADLEIAAAGHTVTIRGKAIDFEEA
jgi:phage baseplate assembly protein gpV